jgi:hypothetical protein
MIEALIKVIKDYITRGVITSFHKADLAPWSIVCCVGVDGI